VTSPAHPGLSPQEVLSLGGWHPRYARVLIAASDGDSGFALVDGNGDGAEFEEELWIWDSGRWGFIKIAADPGHCGLPALVP
jgi:hypothetical protein